MSRISICIATSLVMSAAIVTASAQAPAPAAKKFSRQHLREMMAQWKQNRPKLAACRKQARTKGLAGDDRWFFIEDCMGKS